jgi:hypothetical protein
LAFAPSASEGESIPDPISARKCPQAFQEIGSFHRVENP